MKIAFISEYFPPFAPGGAEWSSFYLARDLSRKEEVIVITPKYRNEKFEDQGLKVFRYPFYLINRGKFSILNSFYHTNLLWIFWSSFFIYKECKKEKIDIIHIQGKFSILPVKLANIFLKKPLVFTARDYQIICNYGFCLYNKDKACSLLQYFTKDFIYYIKNYVKNKYLFTYLFNIVFAISGRLTKDIIKMAAMDMNIIVLSKKQSEIFKKNGFKNIHIIGNSTEFKFKEPSKTKRKILLFAGRLTLGKGVGLLAGILPDFFKHFPDYKFYFAGDGPLKETLLNLKKRFDQIEVLGSIGHDRLLGLCRESRGVVMPSLWQEPFGRVAMEGLSVFTPAVVTHKGGLPEIVKDMRWGYVVDSTADDLLNGIIALIENNDRLIDNIRKDFEEIKRKFGSDITSEYMKIYKNSI